MSRAIYPIILLAVVLAGCQAAPLRTFGDGSLRASAVAFSADGQLLAAGLNDGSVRVWDVASGQLLAQQDGFGRADVSPTRGVAFSADGMSIAFAGVDSTVRLWRPFSNEAPVVLRGHDLPVRQIRFAPDGVRLLTASGGSQPEPRARSAATMPLRVIVYHLDFARELSRIDDICPGGSALCFAPDGERIACLWIPTDASRGVKPAARLILRDARGGDSTQIIESDDATIAMDFAPDSQLLFSGAGVWDVQSGVRIQRLRHDPLSFTDSRTVLTLRHRGTWYETRRTDVITGQSRAGVSADTIPPAILPLGAASVAPDGRSFVDARLRQWPASR